jgi:hypothetical protein
MNEFASYNYKFHWPDSSKCIFIRFQTPETSLCKEFEGQNCVGREKGIALQIGKKNTEERSRRRERCR